MMTFMPITMQCISGGIEHQHSHNDQTRFVIIHCRYLLKLFDLFYGRCLLYMFIYQLAGLVSVVPTFLQTVSLLATKPVPETCSVLSMGVMLERNKSTFI